MLTLSQLVLHLYYTKNNTLYKYGGFMLLCPYCEAQVRQVAEISYCYGCELVVEGEEIKVEDE